MQNYENILKLTIFLPTLLYIIVSQRDRPHVSSLSCHRGTDPMCHEFMNVVLEARYSLGLVNVMKDDPENSKHRFWQFTLGYKFDLGD